ncbi:hypothetical protein EMIHUDRAFT_229419 [Emiliania huxleyi CCMP1516]|uniref:Centriolar and ciliogenesis-associated protein HYLS1 C-terminal domain-containing protein n=2 Tax=Emiliania huxleyi TaxID=2903 RepID=A0A0D3KD48_EMIH1|nr:hypothetical protein EMIHUDRAFT_229419 [Emiliania huxleyi CCMP1516]EOD33683.1 hypothetical protein EMIHUDRAFT_229419 [Emiliania huxleyi CCMP1516]|eukprot:XP_005786112.1 hypothetical protein EMIHUDRAFT_229419 [Emiliania huxleyi CCMP1516]
MKGHEDSNPDVAFEALVRAQLTRMGYDASAVPDEPQLPAAQSPWRPRSVKAPPQFVVPTSKRRDDVVCAVRERLRASEPVDDGRRPARRLTPNHFVPPTEKRRDALRWQVRVGMACAY